MVTVSAARSGNRRQTGFPRKQLWFPVAAMFRLEGVE